MAPSSPRTGSRGRLTIVAAALLTLVGSAACGAETGPAPSASGAPVDAPFEAPVNQAFPLGTEAQFYGPWSPVPFGVPLIVASKMDLACRQSLAPLPVGVALVVIDARGKGIAQLYYAGVNGGMATCNDVALERDGQVMQRGGGSTGNGPAFQALQPFAMELRDQSGIGGRANVTASYLGGRVGAGIAAVELASPQGRVARASLANGWFAVWTEGALPGGWFLVGLDASGATVATLPGS